MAVVGGGDTAFEEASTSPGSRPRSTCSTGATSSGRAGSWSSGARQNPKIEIHTNTGVEEVLGEEKVTGVRLVDTETGEEREMPADGLFVAIGHRPNTEAFRDWLEVDAKGYLVVRGETQQRDRGRVHRR